MSRTARVRALRSGANPSTLDVYGTQTTTPNTATVAAFSVTVGSRRYLPNNATGTSTSPPAVNTAASGETWRDSAAENANEQVRYAAGTWTLRTKVRKTGQTLITNVTIRITWILYHVTSTGTHIAEVGRGVSSDTVLSTADLDVSPSFTTSTPLTLAAGDRLQVEAYVQNILTGGLVGAPAAAYNVVLLLDQNLATTGTAISAQPVYSILYNRALSVSGVGSVSATKRLTLSKSFPVSGTGSGTMSRQIAYSRSFQVTGSFLVGFGRLAVRFRGYSVIGSGISQVSRQLGLFRSGNVTGTGSVSMAKQNVANRAFAVTGTSLASLSKFLTFDRRFSVTGAAAARLMVELPQAVLNRMASGAVTVIRKIFAVFDD